MPSDPRRQCWRSRQTAVHPAEVVVREVESDRCLQVGELLAETKGQSREAPHESADGQIVPLDMAGAYREAIYAAGYHLADGPDHLRRTVTARLLCRLVVLYQNAVIYRASERQVHGVRVGIESIGGNLRTRLPAEQRWCHDPRRKIDHERSRVLRRPLAEYPRGDQLCFEIQSNEEVLIPNRGI